MALERGFHRLYNLDFDGAQSQFAAYQHEHADDPIGPVAEAAAFLFSELYRLGVLRTRFFSVDSATRSRPAPKADRVIQERFDSALKRGEALSQPRLARNPNDQNPLLSMTLINGLRADYSALTVCSDCYDAYIATGIRQYLIGSTSAPVRWVLRMDGSSGDKHRGMADLRLVADRGHYLAPYARIWLASAYLHEKKLTEARCLLIELCDEFPGNPLFTEELAR